MKHDWYPAGGGSVLGTIWQANPMTVALLKTDLRLRPGHAQGLVGRLRAGAAPAAATRRAAWR